MSSENKKYNILLLGDPYVGKSTYIQKLKTGKFDPQYNGTHISEVTNILFDSTKGKICYEICEFSGIEKENPTIKRKLEEGYFHGIILMFSVISKKSFNNLRDWYNIARCGSKIPIVVCGNKADCVQNRVVKTSEIIFDTYYEMSIKTGMNVDEPILYLTNQIYSKHHQDEKASIENTTTPEIKKDIDYDILCARLTLFTKANNMDVSLKLTMKILKDDKLWDKWQKLYQDKAENQSIISFEDKDEIKFCVV
jgi:GTPase SAR1 family protein